MVYYGNNDWRDYTRSRNVIEHFGIPKRSGRYPWGSGEDPYHHGADNPRRKRRELRKIDRTAKKDARRYADAKMYYGEGTGTRRKLLKGELSEKMKNEDYRRSFDKYVEKANYEKSAKKAKRERHARDAARRTTVTLHKVERVMGTTLVGVAGAYYLRNPEKVNNFIRNIANVPISYYERVKAERFVKRYGL